MDIRRHIYIAKTDAHKHRDRWWRPRQLVSVGKSTPHTCYSGQSAMDSHIMSLSGGEKKTSSPQDQKTLSRKAHSLADSSPGLDIRPLFQESRDTLPVVVPFRKPFVCLWIPTRYILHAPYTNVRPVFLCMNHQCGRCTAGTYCQRVHVLCSFMHEVRTALFTKAFSNCCHLHRDVYSQCPKFEGIRRHFAFELVSEGHSNLPRFFVAPDLLAFTAYWENLKDRPIGEVLVVREKRICRLHQRQRCNQGAVCGNVHICRKVWKMYIHLSSMHGKCAYFVRQTAHKTLEMVGGTMDHIRALYSPLMCESIQRVRAQSPE